MTLRPRGDVELRRRLLDEALEGVALLLLSFAFWLSKYAVSSAPSPASSPSAFSTAASASYGDPTCAILPSLPMTTVVGQPEIGYAPMVFFSGSEPTGIVYACWVRNGCITASASYEIASTVRPRSV